MTEPGAGARRETLEDGINTSIGMVTAFPVASAVWVLRARMYRNPSLLAMDEATSALTMMTEHKITSANRISRR